MKHEFDYQNILISKWTLQLYKEHEDISYHYRLDLRRPLIIVEELKGAWGQWHQLTHTIKIDTTLIKNYSWHVVVEILKHEMAHQLVCEETGYQKPHGVEFKLACRRLGVSDWAMKAGGELPKTNIPDWKHECSNDKENRLLQKVEKLLALATSSNEHESLLAMQRVREIYAKYNLEKVKERSSSTMVYLIISRKRKRIEAFESMIVSILCGHFFVNAVYTREFDATDCEEYKAVEILGTRENVMMAEYVYHFLWTKIHSLWDEFRKKTGKSGRSKRSYMIGVLSGFEQKLKTNDTDKKVQESTDLTSEECKSLSTISDAQLKDFIKTRFPRLHTRSSSRNYTDSDSFSAGVSDGGNITLNRPVEQKGEMKNLFLEA